MSINLIGLRFIPSSLSSSSLSLVKVMDLRIVLGVRRTAASTCFNGVGVTGAVTAGFEDSLRGVGVTGARNAPDASGVEGVLHCISIDVLGSEASRSTETRADSREDLTLKFSNFAQDSIS